MHYGQRVLIDIKKNKYEVLCPRSKRVLGKLENFTLLDCHFRDNRIMGTITDSVFERKRVKLKANKMNDIFPIFFADNLVFNDKGVWY